MKSSTEAVAQGFVRAQVENGMLAEWRVYADNEPMRERMRRSG